MNKYPNPTSSEDFISDCWSKDLTQEETIELAKKQGIYVTSKMVDSTYSKWDKRFNKWANSETGKKFQPGGKL